MLSPIQLIAERDKEAVDFTQSAGVEQRLGTADPSDCVELHPRVPIIYGNETKLGREERVATEYLRERIPQAGAPQCVANEALHFPERHRDDLARDVPRYDRLLPEVAQNAVLPWLKLAHD